MTADIEARLAEGLGTAAHDVAGQGVTLEGVRSRVTQRRRRRRAAAAAAALGLVVVAATVAGAASTGDSDGSQVRVADDATTTTSSTTTSTTVANPPPPVGRPSFPPQHTDLEHGGVEWAVVLAVATGYDDRVLAEAVWSAAEVGYETGPTDCDVGVDEIVGLPSEEEGGAHIVSVSLYFESRAEAEAFVAAYEPEVRGIGQVRTFCMD